jgi:hypothetical protein
MTRQRVPTLLFPLQQTRATFSEDIPLFHGCAVTEKRILFLSSTLFRELLIPRRDGPKSMMSQKQECREPIQERLETNGSQSARYLLQLLRESLRNQSFLETKTNHSALGFLGDLIFQSG